MTKENPSVENFRRQLELAPRIQKIRNACSKKTNISLKDLNKSGILEQNLQKYGVFETFDEKNKTAIIIDPKRFSELLEYVDLLEAQLEKDSLDALIESRKGDTGFSSGDRLESEALDVLDENESTIRQFLNKDRP